jgi:hypothetical protein
MVGGVANVGIERAFGSTIDRNAYHVFLTPDGDASLYVAQKTPAGFVSFVDVAAICRKKRHDRKRGRSEDRRQAGLSFLVATEAAPAPLSKTYRCAHFGSGIQGRTAPASRGGWPVPHVLRRQGFPGPIHVSEMFGRRFRAHRTATTGDSDEERGGTRRLGPGNAW